jgi:hypothetical protein
MVSMPVRRQMAMIMHIPAAASYWRNCSSDALVIKMCRRPSTRRSFPRCINRRSVGFESPVNMEAASSLNASAFGST